MKLAMDEQSVTHEVTWILVGDGGEVRQAGFRCLKRQVCNGFLEVWDGPLAQLAQGAPPVCNGCFPSIPVCRCQELIHYPIMGGSAHASYAPKCEIHS